MAPEEIIIGTPVIYYSTITNEGSKIGPFPTVITSDPWEIGGQMCCKVKGKSWAVSILHLEIDEEPIREIDNHPKVGKLAMTFAEAKDQHARDKKFRDWNEMQNDFYEDRDWIGLESALDEAGKLLEQHAASVREEAYRYGFCQGVHEGNERAIEPCLHDYLKITSQGR